MRVVGNAVEGAKDHWEELALLFAWSTQDQAREFTLARQLDRELEAASTAKVAAATGLAQATTALRAKEAEVAEAMALSPGPFSANAVRNKNLGIAALVVGFVLMFALGPVALLPLLAGGVWLWHCGQKLKSEDAAKSQMVAGLIEWRRQLEGPFGAAQHADVTATSALAELHRRRQALTPSKAVKALGRAYLPFLPVDLAGYPVLVDATGSTATTTLKLPDLAANGDELARVEATVENAKRTPILLRPSGDAPSAVHTIHGEENDLAQAIDTFSEILESIPVLTADVPLVAADTPLMRALKGESKPKAAPGAIIRGGETGTRNALAQVKQYTDKMRAGGKNVEQTFRGIRDDLRAILVRYGELRTEAVREAHWNLAEVLKHSDYAHVTYYCPRCNRVPQYLFQKLGVDLDKAHESNPSELLNALQENDDARERIVSDEGLIGDLSNVWQGITELDSAISAWCAQTSAGAAQLGNLDLREAHLNETRLRALQSQKLQLVSQFRALLRKIVTGNPRPVLELSRQARLHLDPDTGEWDCALCELHIDDQEVARMGRLLKIKDELLMPMWNALWTEKDDFRKSELFRTNEQIQRLVEKEVGALRDVSEQYRADMRPVRENLVIAATLAISARDQLDSAVNSLSALGVISEQRATDTMGRLGKMTGGDLDGLKKRAEQKESLLNQEPQSQMSRRVMAIDPIGQLMSPEQLFKETARAAERTSLARRSEGER